MKNEAISSRDVYTRVLRAKSKAKQAITQSLDPQLHEASIVAELS